MRSDSKRLPFLQRGLARPIRRLGCRRTTATGPYPCCRDGFEESTRRRRRHRTPRGDERLAYAFPTYQGASPNTDEPEAELPRIGSVNREALAQGGPVLSRFDASSQILLITACPLSGPIPGLTGWAMTRVIKFAGDSYRLLMAGIGVLLAAVLGAATLLTRLTLSWSRHVGRIEAALKTHEVSRLPTLPMTGGTRTRSDRDRAE